MVAVDVVDYVVLDHGEDGGLINGDDDYGGGGGGQDDGNQW